nr:SDR family oxidoreductase [Pseudonocardia sp. KRD291]
MTGTVLVTGGSRGVGAATARLLAGRGNDVVIGYRADEQAAAAVTAACRASGVRAVAVAADLAVEADVVRLFDTAVAELGPVTGVVANAGGAPSRQRLEDMTPARIDEVLSLNLRAALPRPRPASRRSSSAWPRRSCPTGSG